MDSLRMPVGIVTTKNLDGDDIYSGIYGLELLLDCRVCNVKKFTEKSIRQYLKKLIKLIKMEAGLEPIFVKGIHGLDVIQFILSSQIAVHCVNHLELVFVDIFSCKDFDTGDARQFTQEWFESKDVKDHIVYRC